MVSTPCSAPTAGSCAMETPSADVTILDPAGAATRSGGTLPSVPCNQMQRKLRRIAAAGDAARMEGVPPQERNRVLMEAMIKRKEDRCSRTRCQRCWFPINSSGTNFCICAQLPPIQFRTRVRFLVYMHPRDWYNAGDDAKIFLSAAPNQTELFIYGRLGDDERLSAALEVAEASVLLFPDDSAMTVEEFRQRRAVPEGDGCQAEPELSIVVIDGTWNNVKQMQKHFSRSVSPATPHVRLQPNTLSVYARTQTRKDGISSVEAVALLLQELGEPGAPSSGACGSLLRYLQLNNEALRLRPSPGEDDDG